MCCKKLFIFLPKLSSSKLDNHCKILHKSWILKPSEDLSRGRDNPLREHSNPDQEQEQDGQEGEGGGHVVDGRPQGDEVDDDAGSCSQHLFNLSKSHNHNTMSKDSPSPSCLSRHKEQSHIWFKTNSWFLSEADDWPHCVTGVMPVSKLWKASQRKTGKWPHWFLLSAALHLKVG